MKWVEDEDVMEAVVGAADVAQASGAAPRRPVRVVIAFAQTASIRCLIKWDKRVFNNSAPSAAHS